MSNQTTPPNQVPAAITVDYVVAEMCAEIEDYSTLKKQHFTTLIIANLRAIRLYHKALVQVAYLKINDAGIIPYPPDMVKFLDAGMAFYGQMRSFSENTNMLLNRATDCGEDARHMTDYLSAGGGYFNLYAPIWNTSLQPTYYGAAVGLNQAYYKLDDAARQIQFDGIIPKGEVVLLYTSTGISPNTVITPELITPLKNMAFYDSNKHRVSVPESMKVRYERDKNEAIASLRHFVQSFTKKQYKDILYRSKKQTAKPQ